MLDPFILYISFIFSINNSGLIIGSLESIGFTYKRSVLITIIGMTSGFLLEGNKVANTLLSISPIEIDIQLIITSIILTITIIFGIPISMINILIVSHIGVAIAKDASVNVSNIINIIISWIIAPIIGIIITIILYITLQKILKELPLLSINKFYSIFIQILIFYSAYVLGANNLGLFYINNMLVLLITLTIIIGSFMSKKIRFFVSEGIVGHSRGMLSSSLLSSSLLLWIFTQLSLPLSLSHLLLANLICSNLYRKPSIYNKQRIYLLIMLMIITLILSFLVSYTITFLLGPQ